MQVAAYIGIDPGKRGAWSCLQGDKVTVGPDVETCRRFLRGLQSSPKVLLEKVGSSPQMGVSSAFTFGAEYGKWLGLFGEDVDQISPQKWQFWYMKHGFRDRLEGTKGLARKLALKEIALKLFPEIRVNLTNADALLIAHFLKATNESK